MASDAKAQTEVKEPELDVDIDGDEGSVEGNSRWYTDTVTGA